MKQLANELRRYQETCASNSTNGTEGGDSVFGIRPELLLRVGGWDGLVAFDRVSGRHRNGFRWVIGVIIVANSFEMYFG